jgi:dGTPase
VSADQASSSKKPRRGDRRRPGPKKPEQRAEFERDRDRVLYTDALRRLAGVTQVVGAAEGHLFHNRLTHTLKVAQIARRLAEKLAHDQPTRAAARGGLSADVVEAAALVHDLGHPPFGHIAEEELDDIAREHAAPDGFEGNAQSFRIVTRLAAHRDPDRTDGYEGINLTRASLNAALKYPRLRDVKHPDSKGYRKFGAYDSDEEALRFARAKGPSGDAQCLEAAIMDYADDVAYSVHDLEDFFRAGLIPVASLAQGGDAFAGFLSRWHGDARAGVTAEEVNDAQQTLLSMLRDLFPFDGQYDDTYGHRASLRTATSNLIQRYVWAVKIAVPSAASPLEVPRPVRLQLKFLQRLVWTYVIENPRLATQQHGQRQIIRSLFETYLAAVKARNVALVPALFHRALAALGDPRPAKQQKQDTPEETRLAVDIVASFADGQAVLLHRRLTGVATGSVTDYLTS